jgi:predicted nucleotidyltransferase
MSSITSFLFAEYRRQVLGLLLLHPDMRYHVREIARLTNTTAGTLHRELSKLAKAHVLIREESGNQVYYQANTTFALFEELASILRKTSGLSDVLAEALKPLAKKITAAFIFGSVGRGTETPGSDIDILIIGKISFTDAVKALYSAQTIVKREINPKVYTKLEWKKLLKEDNSFVKEILHAPKLFIIGTINDIE